MSSVNRVILLGNVGKDPVTKHLESGVTVSSFPLATSENFKDKSTGEKKENTEWHNAVAWRSVADSVEKSELKRGDRVYLEGKIKNRKWQDKEGNQRQVTEIVVDTFTIISRKRTDKTEDSKSEESEEAVPSISDGAII